MIACALMFALFAGPPARSAPHAPPPPARVSQPLPARPSQPQPPREVRPPERAPSGFNLPHEATAPRSAAPQYARGRYYGWHGSPVANPRGWHPWGWNHGVVWYPAPIYWGWGFWGPWAIGITPGLIFYGSIIDYEDHVIYPSYVIQASSPGAQLLQNYGLQQTQCGPPNLVVIWGPGNSVVCAFPNDLVGPGNYGFDESTLTIQSLTAPPNQ